MIVFVEGVDGSGKTTLVSQLKLCDYKIVTEVPRFSSMLDTKWIKICEEDLVIIDRGFISDLVYRLQDNDPPGMTLTQMLDILSRHTAIVLCETETSFEDAMSRGEDNIVNKDKSDNIKNLYNTITKMLNKFASIPVYKYNWRNDNIGSIIKFIDDVYWRCKMK